MKKIISKKEDEEISDETKGLIRGLELLEKRLIVVRKLMNNNYNNTYSRQENLT